MALLAEMVNLVAEANRGAYDESLDSLSAAIQIRDQADKADPGAKVGRALPLAARLSLVNVYTQTADPGRAVRRRPQGADDDPRHDQGAGDQGPGRRAGSAQLDLVGKPAPPIAGTSIDGKPVRLADFKGDVVLVVFWASWCLPNAEEAGRLDAIEAAYRAKGFRVLGINLDTVQDGGRAGRDRDAQHPPVPARSQRHAGPT